MKDDTQDDAKEMVLNGFKRKIFLTKSTGAGLFNTNDSKLKVLTPKQITITYSSCTSESREQFRKFIK